MRAKKTIWNVIVSWGMQILIIVGGFIGRTVFISVLNEEYLGLSGLFTNILTVLSLAELGVGTAITFSLYRPIAQKDEKTIRALMNFYRRFYQIVGCFVLAVGSLLTPFLPFFIKELPDIPYIYVIYLLYVLNTGMSYFFSYKAVFINANQEYFITALNHGLCYAGMIVVQMIVLLTTKNFIVYLVVQVAATLIENMIVSHIANRRYPFLKKRNKEKLTPGLLSQIKKNTLAMIGHNLGGIVLTSTDNIVISKFVGIVEVGLYSNYTLLLNAVTALLNQAFSALTASVGNLLVEGTEKGKEDTFYMVYFVNFYFYAFAATALYCLLNPFIQLWLGQEYLFSYVAVAIMVLNFYATGIRQTCIVFKSTAGLFLQDVYKPYVEVVVNLVISVILVQNYGIVGVLIGTLISTIFVVTWIEPVVLFKYGFQKSPWKYFARYILYAVVTLVCVFGTQKICELVTFGSVAGFLCRMLIVVIVPNLLILILFGRTAEFKRLKDTLLTVAVEKKAGKKKEDVTNH